MKRLLYCSVFSVLLLLGVGAAACGGGGGESTSTPAPTDGSSTTTAATSTRTAPAREVGQVDNADGNARVNGARANQNLKLRAGDHIETGKDSSIDFSLAGTPAVECKTRSDSDLFVRPDDKTQLQWKSRSGVSFCNVERGQPPVLASFGIDPNVTIEVEGTLFGISEQGTLRVVEGFVLVRTGNKTERIGPNEGVPLLANGQTGPREVWQGLVDDEQELVGDLQAQRKPPQLQPTAAEVQQSKLLGTIASSRSLRVLLDNSATDDDEQFMWSYFGRLMEEWAGTSDNLDVQRVTAAQAAAQLRDYPNAVYVVPAPAGGASPTASPYASPKPNATATPAALNLDREPFYIGGNAGVWNVSFLKDPAAVTAFSRYTHGILSTGDYFDMYFDLFSKAPSYDRLLQLIP